MCVAVAADRYHALGWTTALGAALGTYRLQRHAFAAVRQTSAAILNDHALQLGEVWDVVKPNRFQQPTASERLAAARGTVAEVVHTHGPAVLHVTARGAFSLAFIGFLQPVATAAACFAVSAPLTAPKAPAPTKPVDIQERFRLQIEATAEKPKLGRLPREEADRR